MNSIFKLSKNTCDLRNAHLFESQNCKTKRYGLDCITYIISQILGYFEVRDTISLKTFKHKIKLGIAIRACVTVARLTITTYDLLKCNHYIVYFL